MGLQKSGHRVRHQTAPGSVFITFDLSLQLSIAIPVCTLSTSSFMTTTCWFVSWKRFLGTVFLELWKRHRNTLAYEWDVNSFENTEPDRPEFVGNTVIRVRHSLSNAFDQVTHFKIATNVLPWVAQALVSERITHIRRHCVEISQFSRVEDDQSATCGLPTTSICCGWMEKNPERIGPRQITRIHTNQGQNINKWNTDQTGTSTLSHDKASILWKNNAISLPTNIKLFKSSVLPILLHRA